ncbi:uncharacterized protein C10orf105-like [Rhinoraja longicauda]
MSSETKNGTTVLPDVLKLLLTTTEAQGRVEPPTGAADPLPTIIAVISIFLLLATCVSFVALCNPAGLDSTRYGPYECMPYHAEDASEPRLKLWKRLGSLRHSLNSFRRNRPLVQPQATPATQCQVEQNDSDFAESTKM